MEIIIYSATKEMGRGKTFMNCKRFKDTKGDGRDLLTVVLCHQSLEWWKEPR